MSLSKIICKYIRRREMTKFYKILSLILALIFVMGALAACSTPDDPAESTPSNSVGGSDTPEETPVETEPPKDPITLTAEYVVVRPELCSDAVKDAAIAVKNALADATGANVAIKEDFLYGDLKPAQYEILVGQTNREESVNAISGIKYNDYIVSIEGDKLVVNAYTDECIAEAVAHVVSVIENADGAISFTDADQITVRAEYAVESIAMGDNNLKGYSIILPKASTAVMKMYAEKLQMAICRLSGEYLPIKNETADETEKEILLGDTNRAASASVDSEALGAGGFEVKADGAKIVVKSNDKGFAFLKTIEDLISDMADGSIEAAKGTKVGAEKLTMFTFTDVHNNFAMLEPTNSTGDYIVRKNVDKMIDHLLATEGAVDLVMVGGDLMSDYPSWDSSGNWPYKYFVEYRALLDKTFARLTKDGKVIYCGGNHDYGQGEGAKDAPHTDKGNYNSSDFYFGDVGMMQSMGVLAEEDMYWKIGTNTGDKYLIAYHYELNGIHVMGLAPDPDIIWSKQGDGFSDESLAWMKKKLKEIDPYGTEIIFVNCHYPLHNTYEATDGECTYPSQCVASNSDHSLCIRRNSYNYQKLAPVFSGHSNLFHFFGHWESWYHDYSVRAVIHYNKANNPVAMNGDETDSTQILAASSRSFTSVNMGHFRPMYNDSPKMFELDHISGYGGYSTYTVQHGSTRTPKCGQGMYVKVFEDRIEFTMKNIGTYKGLTTEDILSTYTVYLYK